MTHRAPKEAHQLSREYLGTVVLLLLLLLLYTKGAVECLKHIHVMLSRNSTCSSHGVMMGIVPAGEALAVSTAK